MSIEDLLKHIGNNASDGQHLAKRLSEISRLDKKRTENLGKLRKRVAKFDDILDKLDADTSSALRSWLEEFSKSLDATTAEVRKSFGADLDRQLDSIGIKLKGQYPLLKAGLFVIEVDFEKGVSQIGYGMQQEMLLQTSIDATTVATELEKQLNTLGSRGSAEDFVKLLRSAYTHASVDLGVGNSVPITALLVYVALGLQTSAFRTDPIRQKYRSYSRADFSYDLYIHHKEVTSAFHLRIATRQQTQRRSDFLWIPTDSLGEGSAFAIIERKGD